MTMTYAQFTVAYPHPAIPPLERIRSFTMNPKAYSNTLHKQLRAVYPGLCDDLKDAVLWKASGVHPSVIHNVSKAPIHKWIKEREKSSIEIVKSRTMEQYFPGHPAAPSRDRIDIVVVTPDILEDVTPYGATEVDFGYTKSKSLSIPLSRVFTPDTDQLTLSHTLVGSTTPDHTEDFAAIKAIALELSEPRYSRPFRRSGPHTALFDKHLGVLWHDIKHHETLSPSKSTVINADELTYAATTIFTSEDQRQLQLLRIIGNLLEAEVGWHESMADGTLRSGGVLHEGFFIPLVLELRNEPGGTYLEGLDLYSKIIKRAEYSKYVSRSNLPVILLGLAGSQFAISTAVHTDAVCAVQLASFNLNIGVDDDDTTIHLAQLFTAITKCIKDLRNHYRSLPRLQNSSRVMYPNPTAELPDVTLPHLEFISKLDRVTGTPVEGPLDLRNECHGIYLAKMEFDAPPGHSSTRVVLVKFALRYNEKAHRLLAERNPPYAPALYSCTQVLGGLYMVIMEYLSGASSLHRFFTPSQDPPLPHPPTADIVCQGLSKALDILHGKDYVFGDLCSSNVLYAPEDKRIFLVDFDHVGTDGKDKYPPCFGVNRGLGVMMWQTMERWQDRANLERIIEWLPLQK